MKKLKRMIVIIFFAFLASDICSYIRYYISNKSLSVSSYNLFVSKMTYDGTFIFNLAMWYFIFVCIIYFLCNFFKPSYKENF